MLACSPAAVKIKRADNGGSMMKTIQMTFAAAFVAATFLAGSASISPAQAQATCRNKCNTEEQACLKRTGNKSQCGSRAQTCAAKCK